MGITVRSLNEEGIQKFREYLRELREGIPVQTTDILCDRLYSSEMSKNIEIENILFKDKHDLTAYLYSKLFILSHSEIEKDRGLWSWLALYYLDQLCPPNNSGMRTAGQDYRYILEPRFRYYHRHLLLGPYSIYLIHADRAPLLLSGPIYKTGSFYVELSSRQGLITNRGVIEAANLLYFDKKNKKPKKGAALTEKKPGTLLRFINVMQQLDLTHDLYSMPGEEILELLPPEFDEWKVL